MVYLDHTLFKRQANWQDAYKVCYEPIKSYQIQIRITVIVERFSLPLLLNCNLL